MADGGGIVFCFFFLVTTPLPLSAFVIASLSATPPPSPTQKPKNPMPRTLYWGSGSAPAWRVQIALAEKKLVRGERGGGAAATATHHSSVS